MRKLGLPILISAILAAVALVLPRASGPSMAGLFLEIDRTRLFLMVVALVTPIGLAGWLLAGKPARPWHAFAALGGFAYALFKTQAWRVLRDLGAADVPTKLQAGALVAGVVLTMLAIVGDDPASRDATS